MDSEFKVKIVKLIFSNEIEDALNLLSQNYGVKKPKLKVGMPKGHSKTPACYAFKSQTIHVSRNNVLNNPRVILHEFYHHLRNNTNSQRGAEKFADNFANNYMKAFNRERLIIEQGTK